MIDLGAERVVRASYVLRQQFRYEYPGPIEQLRHRLVVAPPPVYGDQVRLAHRLTASPGLRVTWAADVFGNLVATVDAPRVEREVAFDYEATVVRSLGPAPEPDATATTCGSKPSEPRSGGCC